MRRGRPPHADILTPREWEVLLLIKDGLTNDQIAERLGISRDGAKYHVSQILSKLSLNSRREAADWEPPKKPLTGLAALLPGVLRGALLTRVAGWGVLAGAITVLVLLAVGVALSRSRNGAEQALVEVSPSPAPEATPVDAEPYRREFVRGEVVDVAPAVAFVDSATGAVITWVLPPLISPEIGVSPSGSYIVYDLHGEVWLLRTDNNTTHLVEARYIPLDYGPDDQGFVAFGINQTAVGVFDGYGTLRFEVPLDGGSFLGAAWSNQGLVAIAHEQAGEYVLGVYTLAGDRLSQVSGALRPEEPMALRWSNGGNQLAVVTLDRLYVMQPDGEVLWEVVLPSFLGNPRWSPGDSHLFVNAIPPGGPSPEYQPEANYVFESDGRPLFRVVSSYVGGCYGDPWLAEGGLQLGTDVFDMEGRIVRSSVKNLKLLPDLEALGLEVEPEIGIHLPRWGRSIRTELDDGRLVFTTSRIGFGGTWCDSVSHEPRRLVVEYPPFAPDVP